jgi:hypothetical protein
MSPFLGLLTLLAAQGEVGPESAHPRRLLVRLAPHFERTPTSALAPGLEHAELWNLPQIGWRALEVPLGKREESRARLAAVSGVLAVEHDLGRELASDVELIPNDVLFASQWYLGQTRVPVAWNRELGEAGVVVAVMDTGVDLAHPDLAANLWTNAGEIPGNGLDDDENGYADDVHGYDFAYLDPNPSDDNGHGTACAGIVGAVQGNALGISGVAPGCRVAVLKAALANGKFYASANVPALVYAAEMGFRVLSMSFFSDEVVPAERDAIAYCVANGVLPIAAAGNANSVLPSYPAAYPQVLAVGATFDASDARAFFSGFGSWVGVAAPGWALATTSPFGGYTSSFSGTSGAAPQVAGIAALLFSANPAATADGVRAALEDACTPLYEAPYGHWTSYGRVDAERALDRVLGLASGSVPARLAFAAPCGGKGLERWSQTLGHGTRRDWFPLELVGVGLEPPNPLELLVGTRTLALLSQQRRSVTASGPFQPGGLAQLLCHGAPVASWVWDDGPGWVFGATDASTDNVLGGTLSGAWPELYRSDGVSMTCTRNALARVSCSFAVRGVRALEIARMTLEFRRDYDGMDPGALETLEIYDWSSASHPYGTWVTLATSAAPLTWKTLVLDLPGDPDRFVDPEGSFYLRLSAEDAGPSGILKADSLRLRMR